MGVLARLEGGLLFLLGAAMLSFTQSPAYWVVLNPRFSPVTMAAGLGLVFTGLALFMYPRTKPNFWAAASLVAVLGLFTVFDPQGVMGPAPGSNIGNPAQTFDGEPVEEEEIPLAYTLNGQDYLPMNLAELFIRCDNDTVGLHDHVAVRGVVLRTPELDAQGDILLARTTVVCCLADALTVAVRVHVGDADAFTPNQWVRVLGTVEPLAVEQEDTVDVRLPFSVSTVVQTICRLRADAPDSVTPVNPPGMEFVFEMRQEPPFAY
jgi:hypothetical protein